MDWQDEDSERLRCSGDVDLALFESVARVEYMTHHPLFSGPAKHVWLRPLTMDYALRTYAGMTSERVASKEHYEPCGPGDDGALPFTVIDTAR